MVALSTANKVDASLGGESIANGIAQGRYESIDISVLGRLRLYSHLGILTPQAVFQNGIVTNTSSTPGDVLYGKEPFPLDNLKFATVRGYVLSASDPELQNKFSLDWNAYFSVAIEKPGDTPRMIADRRKGEIEELCRKTALLWVAPEDFEIIPMSQKSSGPLEDAVKGCISPNHIKLLLVHESYAKEASMAFEGTSTQVLPVENILLHRVPTYTKDKQINVPAYLPAIERLTQQESLFGHLIRLP